MKEYQILVAWDKKYTNRRQNKPSVMEFIPLPHVTSFLESISEKKSFLFYFLVEFFDLNFSSTVPRIARKKKLK